MKKLIVILVIILGISLIAYAGVTKIDLAQWRAAVEDESGWVIVNINPQKIILEFQVDGLPVGEYWAYYWDFNSDPVVLGQLKVNKFGSGHLNAHVSEGISESFQVGIADDISVVIGNDQVVLYVNLP